MENKKKKGEERHKAEKKKKKKLKKVRSLKKEKTKVEKDIYWTRKANWEGGDRRQETETNEQRGGK